MLHHMKLLHYYSCCDCCYQQQQQLVANTKTTRSLQLPTCCMAFGHNNEMNEFSGTDFINIVCINRIAAKAFACIAKAGCRAKGGVARDYST